jgi:heterodisulfide reductase subunit A-like polyferredoxin
LLYLWRCDVRRYLSLEDALSSGVFPIPLRGFVHLAWHYANTRGYINFGVAEAILQQVRQPASTPTGGSSLSVVILGAGLAGLAASHQLLRMGYKVLVLEAKGYPGGRVRTVRMEVRGVLPTAIVFQSALSSSLT